MSHEYYQYLMAICVSQKTIDKKDDTAYVERLVLVSDIIESPEQYAVDG